MERYTFKCGCIACEKNYPLQTNLKVIDVPVYNASTNRYNLDSQLIKKYCDYINLHFEKNFPCKELVEIMEKNKQYHKIITDSIFFL